MKSQNYIPYLNVLFNLKDICFFGLWLYRGTSDGIIRYHLMTELYFGTMMTVT